MDELEQDLNNWYFGGESDGAFALQHPNGNPLVIAKNTLSPETQDQIRGLAGLDDEQKKPFFERVGKHIGSSFRDGISSGIEANKKVLGAVASPVIDAGKGILQGVSGYDPGAQAAPQPTRTQAAAVVPPVDYGPATSPDPTGAVAPQAQPQIATPTANDMMRPFNMQQQAAKQTLDYNNLAAQEAAKIHKQYVDQIQKTESEFSERDAERQKLINEHNKDLNDPSQAIDPSRKWNSMGTGNKIIAAISIALSGMGSKWTGGRNMALEVIDNAINRDIDAQKQNKSNKMSMYQKLIEQGKSDLEATTLLKSMYLGRTEAQMKLFASSNAGLMNSANYLNTSAAIQGQQNELKTKYSRMGLDQRLGNGTASFQELMTYGSPEQQKGIIPLAGSDKYLKVADDNKKDVQNSISAFKNISYKIDRLNQLGASALVSKDKREEAKQTISALTGDLLKSNDMTRLSPQTIKLLEEQISDPTKFLNWVADNPAEANTRLKKILLNDLVNDLQGKVLNPQALPYVLGPPRAEIPTKKLGTGLKK